MSLSSFENNWNNYSDDTGNYIRAAAIGFIEGVEAASDHTAASSELALQSCMSMMERNAERAYYWASQSYSATEAEAWIQYGQDQEAYHNMLAQKYLDEGIDAALEFAENRAAVGLCDLLGKAGMTWEVFQMATYAANGDWDNLGRSSTALLLGIGAAGLTTALAPLVGAGAAAGLIGAGLGLGSAMLGEFLFDMLGVPTGNYLGEWLYDHFGDSLGGAGGSGPSSDAQHGNSGSYQYQWYSPLVIDLDSDGLEFVNVAQSGAYFDLDADDFANNAAWLSPDDGFLALDWNSDGVINNINELFGDRDGHGFDILAQLDTNYDNVIDAQDTQFLNLKIWQDLNGDGVSQSNELKTLEESGITAINLSYTTTTVPTFNR